MKKLLLSAAILSLVTTSNAANVNGNVKFSVEVPEILVLYHWNSAHLNLTAPTNKFVYSNSDRTKDKEIGSTGDAEITGNVVTTTVPTGFSATDTLKVKLVNSWAIRSISDKKVQLALTTPNGVTLTKVGATGSTIAIGSPVLKSTSASPAVPAGATSLTFNPGWTPKLGNIEFTLNLASANSKGTYTTSGAASGGNDNTFNLELSTTTTAPTP